MKLFDQDRLLVIAGPCQIEGRDHALMVAEKLSNVCRNFGVNFVYKSSFDKANRTSANSERGVGMEEGLRILQEVRRQIGCPILSDIHLPDQATVCAEILDIIQIPAFLSRQTDLLQAAGKTGRIINIKKGQFMHPADMFFAAEKIEKVGNNQIMLCERGSSFGYRDLVVDMRSLIIMRSLNYPVIFDATHSVQSVGGAAGRSGGASEYVIPLAKAALAVGVDGIFVETHNDPTKAPSDGSSMLPLDQFENLLSQAVEIDRLNYGSAK